MLSQQTPLLIRAFPQTRRVFKLGFTGYIYSFVYFSVTLSVCIHAVKSHSLTHIPHEKCLGMLTQWFCITLNSMAPVLPPIWDPLAPKAEAQLVLLASSSSAGPSVPACRLVCRSSTISRSMTMQTKGEKCPSNGHLYPRPTLTSLQVHGCFCLVGSLSLYIPIAHTYHHHTSPHDTHIVADKRVVLCLQQ